MDEKEIRALAEKYDRKHGPLTTDDLARFGAEIAKACYEDAANHPDQCTYAGMRKEALLEKAAALGGQK